ncbi:hypothetical protein EYC84_011912 [Monilinia fructicola]|uniref:Uncharacterized protein n=1 Tax=Monilinia fructicola TaxID=38448 RepID=A0A5M9J6Q5_MONFR|nr:hypothetical protein EYC84_011912 [Monilinia fructicola]
MNDTITIIHYHLPLPSSLPNDKTKERKPRKKERGVFLLNLFHLRSHNLWVWVDKSFFLSFIFLFSHCHCLFLLLFHCLQVGYSLIKTLLADIMYFIRMDRSKLSRCQNLVILFWK